MQYIVYISAARRLFTEEELSDLQALSWKNNLLKGVTGLLLYHEGSVLQVLEGNKDDIDSLYIRILQDTRHKNIITVMEGETVERNFKEWSMGYRRISKEQWNQVTGYIQPDQVKTMLPGVGANIKEVAVILRSFMQTNFSAAVV